MSQDGRDPGSGGSMPARQRRAKPKPSDEARQEPEGRMVGRGGLEPPTSRLSGVRSNHLSYRPGFRFAKQNKTSVRQGIAKQCPRAALSGYVTQQLP